MTSQEANIPLSLPDTQNADVIIPSQDGLSQKPTLVVWGRLCPIRTPLMSLEMIKESYTVGRATTCDVVFTINEMQQKYLNIISKVHFRIVREYINNSNEFIVYLEDMSHNGTFVDKVKVGYGNRVIIENNSEIAIAAKHLTIYVFMNIMSDNSCELPLELKQMYALGRKLGTGACGEVRLLFTKDGSKRFAIKIIQMSSINQNRFNNPMNIKNEVEILKRLRHPCIIQMENIYDTPTTMYIILELMEGGELFDKIRSKNKLSESCAKLIFYQVILAVHYLHKQGITHRDLKPENILLKDNSDTPLVKVSDFGLSKLVDAQTMMKTFCGTPMYVAPEILANLGRGSYTSQVDVWSLGVILYACLSGIVPFNIHNTNITLEYQIKRGKYQFPSSRFGNVSHDAIELIKRMMTVNPTERITVPEILLHPWLRDQRMREEVNMLISHVETDENVPPSNVLINEADPEIIPEIRIKRTRLMV
ncbi:serine/threonine-protein kinase Chk2-like [Nylanderia fulva]|uniref:serine/threonine-protein kinase Chk2-like n=1 Tax=Nylanderia fulva TaxID=613905 RepID=UPI0010FAD7E8|nr:serine/threonine-protein kinase Chk2-like [Nylanderia fulva]XP_029161515.1 serine/threonine-protein kinase Chk2-like [Nylanderia fulva]